MSGISAADAIGRFRYRLSKELGSTKVEDKGQYVVLHEKFRLRNRDLMDVSARAEKRHTQLLSP